MAAPEHRDLPHEEVAVALDTLRLLSDQLELFLDGDDTAWSDDQSLQLHTVAVRARYAVNEVRAMRAADERRAEVVPLTLVPHAATVIPLDPYRPTGIAPRPPHAQPEETR